MSDFPQHRLTRVAFRTLGCRLNQYDTEGMKASLGVSGSVKIVPWDSQADVYVLNSCTVTGKADQECRRLARQAKRRSPRSKVVVAGCYAQTQPDSLLNIDEVDGVIGNSDKDDISGWLPDVTRSGEQVRRVSSFAAPSPFTAPIVQDFGGRSRAYVKVQDGCDLRCAYCLIWRARGPARSRTLPDILRQLRQLREQGFAEVVLAGVHLGSYGRDLGQREDLAWLLRTVMEALPDIRLRLSSIHPNEVSPQLLELLVQRPHLRPHLHISLQSGANSVLRRMRRPYRSEDARQAVLAAASARPDIGLGADIIVGYPGETEAEFAETYRFIESLPFSYLHVFRFSPRPETVAAELPEPVHPEAASERSQRLRDLAAAKQRAFQISICGQWREAVVEAVAGVRGLRQAMTDNYASLFVPDRWTAGSLVRVRPERDSDGSLRAEAIVAVETSAEEP